MIRSADDLADAQTAVGVLRTKLREQRRVLEDRGLKAGLPAAIKSFNQLCVEKQDVCLPR